MKTLAFFFALLWSAAFAAESLKFASITINGREYKQATITLVEERFARVVHEAGSARYPISLVSEDIRKQLGYDPVAAAKAEEAQKKADTAVEQQRILDAAPFTRFWVSENLQNGLVVGGFEEVTTGGGVVAQGLTRVGGGGSSFVYEGRKSWERTYVYAFIPHTAETLNFTDEKEFQARVIQDGTFRLDAETVVPKYRLLAVQKP